MVAKVRALRESRLGKVGQVAVDGHAIEPLWLELLDHVRMAQRRCGLPQVIEHEQPRMRYAKPGSAQLIA